MKPYRDTNGKCVIEPTTYAPVSHYSRAGYNCDSDVMSRAAAPLAARLRLSLFDRTIAADLRRVEQLEEVSRDNEMLIIVPADGADDDDARSSFSRRYLIGSLHDK